jgi:hypothetical protein
MSDGRPERAARDGDQALPVPGRESVFLEVRRRLDAREVLGVKRYGRTLETFNGRDVFTDAEDELLDRYVYSVQARMEHHAVVEALLVLARHVVGGAGGAELQAAGELAAGVERRR